MDQGVSRAASKTKPSGPDSRTTRGARVTEQIAAKNALQEAGALIAERMLPKIVGPAKPTKESKKK